MSVFGIKKDRDGDGHLVPISEIGGGSSEPGGGGGVSSYNDLSDKPFWKETVEESHFGEFTVTTAYDSETGVNFAQSPFAFANKNVKKVIFDGVEYECTFSFDTTLDEEGIGSASFDGYPFFIGTGIVITQTPGEHTIELYETHEEIKADYAPCLIVSAQYSDGKESLKMEDVEKIEYAFANGIPIRLITRRGNMHVTDASGDFIYAYGCRSNETGLPRVDCHEYRKSDGSMKGSCYSVFGTISENADSIPVIYINNQNYKITLGESGTLIATKM